MNEFEFLHIMTEFPLNCKMKHDNAAFLWCVIDIHWTSVEKVTSLLLSTVEDWWTVKPILHIVLGVVGEKGYLQCEFQAW